MPKLGLGKGLLAENVRPVLSNSIQLGFRLLIDFSSGPNSNEETIGALLHRCIAREDAVELLVFEDILNNVNN